MAPCDFTTVHVTPQILREIADDLEREGHGLIRSLESTDGRYVDLLLPPHSEDMKGRVES